jgi:hypothetical protein
VWLLPLQCFLPWSPLRSFSKQKIKILLDLYLSYVFSLFFTLRDLAVLFVCLFLFSLCTETQVRRLYIGTY